VISRVFAAALVILSASSALAGSVPEPDGYRMEAFRAPVPATVAGATAIGVEAAHALWLTDRVLFLDVLPRPPKPANLPAGTVWRDKPRDSIPGAIWAPNTGFGKLTAEAEAYLRDTVATATGGDKNAPIVVFCLNECWMSWNASKRLAAEMGYTHVFWFSQGTDGWADAGLPLERIEPAP
jgi:PQQ-dependent catabolism-associated CXXCW motif protein